MQRNEVLRIAVETGFMLHTGYGQDINKQMPVSDTATLLEFAENIIKQYKIEQGEDNGS